MDSEYPRTNDAWLYAYEWDAEAGAYVVYLDYLCNGGRITRERIGRVEHDGSAVVEQQLTDAPGRVRPSHPALYAVRPSGTTAGNAITLVAEPLRFR